MIAFRAFTKRFGGHTAVDRLTLTVERGETIALLGPNGSGKTTTLKAAAGLVWPSSGGVLLDGRPATDRTARQAISYLPQRVAFPDSLTGREVVDFYRRLRGVDAERREAALRLAALNGASTRAVETYSGGMVQRLGLAVALVPDAPILLLDEPTAALDPDGLCAFYGIVEQRKRAGQTVFFTSHQLGDAERLADRFGVIVEGRLVALLSARELADRLSTRGVLRVRVAKQTDSIMAAVRTVSPRAVVRGDEVIVPGPASIRPAVVDLVRAGGGEITGLTAEEGRLDMLYRELVAEQPV